MVTRAKKSIASFKLREEQPIGVKVTLRGDRAWEFFDRLLSLAIPRIRDFRGLSPKSFDGHGNYTFGVNDQLIFPEVDYDRVDTTRGMDITICTTARSDDEGRAFLDEMKDTWTGLNSFMLTHNWWHLSLVMIEQGEGERVLDHYASHIWGVWKEYSQDQIGAVSLLARLELAGVAVGDRWQDLADHLVPVSYTHLPAHRWWPW